MKREGFNVIGKDGLRDKQSVEAVCGQLTHCDDVLLGKKLIAAQLGSKYAHCRVLSIDASDALAMPGVEAVMDHTEVPGWSEEKYFVGDPVAVVAATSWNIAMEALQKIKVEYEERPAVIDPEEAMGDNAPLTGLWPEANTNQRTEFTRKGTDLDAGFDAATGAEITVVSGYSNNHDNHSIGGGNSTCWWNGDGMLISWTDTQNVHSTSRGLASSFGLANNQVMGFTKGNGAGFGGGRANVQVQAAALAKKTGKPVSFHIDRKNQMETAAHQFATKQTTHIGADANGIITAIDMTYWTDQGMSRNSPMTGTHQCFEHIFPTENFHALGIGISTNTVGRSYYR